MKYLNIQFKATKSSGSPKMIPNAVGRVRATRVRATKAEAVAKEEPAAGSLTPKKGSSMYRLAKQDLNLEIDNSLHKSLALLKALMAESMNVLDMLERIMSEEEAKKPQIKQFEKIQLEVPIRKSQATLQLRQANGQSVTATGSREDDVEERSRREVDGDTDGNRRENRRPDKRRNHDAKQLRELGAQKVIPKALFNQRLLEVANILHNIFVAANRSVLLLKTVITKLNTSYRT